MPAPHPTRAASASPTGRSLAPVLPLALCLALAGLAGLTEGAAELRAEDPPAVRTDAAVERAPLEQRFEQHLLELVRRLDVERLEREAWEHAVRSAAADLGPTVEPRLRGLAADREVRPEPRVAAIELLRALSLGFELEPLAPGAGGPLDFLRHAELESGRAPALAAVAARSLAAFGTVGDVEYLVARLEDAPDPARRASAAWALEAAPPELAGPALAARLTTSRDPSTVELAAIVLAASGPRYGGRGREHLEVARALHRRLSDPALEPAVRAALVEALARLGGVAGRRALYALLARPDTEPQLLALTSERLATLDVGGDTGPLLFVLHATGSSSAARVHAAELLYAAANARRESATPCTLGEARQALERLIFTCETEPEPELRIRAARALSLFPAPGVVELLNIMAEQDPHEGVRTCAVLGLARIRESAEVATIDAPPSFR